MTHTDQPLTGEQARDICRRVGELRKAVCGERGKSAFAARLGISPSTYDYYESGRVPPAEIILRAARIGSVRPCWLLTGETYCSDLSAWDAEMVQRLARVLDRAPGATRQINAFLDLLDDALGLATDVDQDPGDARETGQTGGAVGPPCQRQHDGAPDAEPDDTPQAGPLPPRRSSADTPGLGDDAREGWIPILGHSAAGVPAFWADPALAEGIVELADLIERPGRALRQARRPATVASNETDPGPTALVTLTSPDGAETAEYVLAGDLQRRYPDAFALRIDGRSMSPELEHGDVVVLSPSCPALPGRPAVVQLRGQIGVTCKLYRPAGDDVHLVAIDPDTPPTSARGAEVVWAFRVLGRVRPAGGER